MTRVAPTPALARLRGQFPSPTGVRVVYHRGHQDEAKAERVHDSLRQALGEVLVAGACDGACWAAPAATVQREAHQHRFALLEPVLPEALTQCVEGQCEDEYAGRGAYGLLERLGRQDGSFGDAVVRGAFGALAQASAIGRDRTGDAVRASGFGMRYGVQRVGDPVVVTAAQSSDETPSIDLHLLEGDPFRLIDGLLVAAVAVGARRAIVHLEGQPSSARATFEDALALAREHGILDGSVLEGPAVEIEVRDDTSEGPVMSLEAVAALSTVFDAPPPPTRLVALGGAIPRPGVYEVPVGGTTTWTGVLALGGAVPGLVPALRVGLDGVVPGEAFEETVTPKALGDGSVVVLPREDSASPD